MGENIDKTEGSCIVIPFKKPEKTNSSVYVILNQSFGYDWSKDNIIGALLCNGTLDVIGDRIDYLLSEEYAFLYEKLIEFICSIGELYYHESGYTFEYNKEKNVVYMVDDATIKSNESYKLNINLINNDDYSDTAIEVSHNGNIMLILSSKGYAMTGYIPFEDYDL